LKPSRRLTVAPIPSGIRSIPVRERIRIVSCILHQKPGISASINSSAMKPGGTVMNYIGSVKSHEAKGLFESRYGPAL
jgi:hypothetical protein